MKRILLISVIGSLAACSSVKPQTSYTPAPMPVAVQSAPVPVQTFTPQEQAVRNAVSQIPDWFVEVPRVENTIHAGGDGVSGSISGAIAQARANAFEGICQAAGGKVRSQTKVFRTDTEKSSTSVSTTAIRNLCPDVDVTGAVVEKRKIIQDGSRFRAYLLVALPVGEANVLARTKQADKMQELAIGNKEREFKELDQLVDTEKKVENKPVSRVEPVELNLLDVDNAEYKRRRDEALAKPNAVIGQVTLR